MRILLFITFFSFFSQGIYAEKIKLIFDIDETLAWNTTNLEIAESIKKKYPSMRCTYCDFSKGRTFYFFVPYFKEMLLYFISHNFEVHFFSAGSEKRNITILSAVLRQIFGDASYDEYVNLGQFKVFSAHHMVPSILVPEGHQVQHVLCKDRLNEKGKCLKTIFPNCPINKMILFDNLPMNAFFSSIEVENNHFVELEDGVIIPVEPHVIGAFNQRSEEKIDDVTQLPVVAATTVTSLLYQLHHDVLSSDAFFSLNHAIYFVGVVQKALLSIALNVINADENTPKLTLRSAIFQVLGEHARCQFYEAPSDPANLSENENRDELLKCGLHSIRMFDSNINLFDDPDFKYFE